MDIMQICLAILSGALVGFSLGLVGGGGSILAVPLMVYVVGVDSPHVAIGTSALAVAANATTGLIQHAKAGNVRWRIGLLFAGVGVVGAAFGSTLGKNFDGQKLLLLFSLVMIGVGIAMVRQRKDSGSSNVRLSKANAPRVAAFGFGTGGFSGFFGIGGGFLIVPALGAATGMAVIDAVGTSLIAVTAFGITTAANYALSGMVDWGLAGLFIVGGIGGGFAGTRAAERLSSKGQLKTVFAAVIFVVAFYMLWQSWKALGL